MKTKNVIVKITLATPTGREVKTEYSHIEWGEWATFYNEWGEWCGMMPYVNLAEGVKRGTITIEGYGNIPKETRDLIDAIMEGETRVEMVAISDAWEEAARNAREE
jgi:hypothetical protein